MKRLRRSVVLLVAAMVLATGMLIGCGSTGERTDAGNTNPGNVPTSEKEDETHMGKDETVQNVTNQQDVTPTNTPTPTEVPTNTPTPTPTPVLVGDAFF